MPSLIIIMGLPGAGKTFFAKILSRKIGSIHINSDLIRKELYQQPDYTATDKATVYQAMFNRVCKTLREGQTVIVDATFSRHAYRLPYFEFAKQNQIPIYILFITAKEDTIAQRLQKKRPDSDADFAVYKKIKSEFEPLKMNHCTLHSDELSLEEMTRISYDFIGITT